jgi:hypothetical protein
VHPTIMACIVSRMHLFTRGSISRARFVDAPLSPARTVDTAAAAAGGGERTLRLKSKQINGETERRQIDRLWNAVSNETRAFFVYSDA